MSGGVDSSVAAALLLDQGHDVTGVTLKLWGGESDSGCCSVADVEDARRVAAQLGIPHYVFNFTDDFDDRRRRSLRRCATRPARRRTRAWSATARSSSAGCSSGPTPLGFDLRRHRPSRAGRARGAEAWRLLRGADAAKDQSYVLYMLGQRQLARTLFPVGELTKAEVRAARGADSGCGPQPRPRAWTCASSPAAAVRRSSRHAFRHARVRSSTRPGRLSASTRSVTGFTVGQRRGLGVATGERRYVVDVDARAATVTIGARSDLLRDAVVLRDLVFVDERTDSAALVRRRCARTASRSTATLDGDHRAVRAPQPRGSRPGQVVALYDGDSLVGGGIAT